MSQIWYVNPREGIAGRNPRHKKIARGSGAHRQVRFSPSIPASYYAKMGYRRTAETDDYVDYERPKAKKNPNHRPRPAGSFTNTPRRKGEPMKRRKRKNPQPAGLRRYRLAQKRAKARPRRARARRNPWVYDPKTGKGTKVKHTHAARSKHGPGRVRRAGGPKGRIFTKSKGSGRYTWLTASRPKKRRVAAKTTTRKKRKGRSTTMARKKRSKASYRAAGRKAARTRKRRAGRTHAPKTTRRKRRRSRGISVTRATARRSWSKRRGKGASAMRRGKRRSLSRRYVARHARKRSRIAAYARRSRKRRISFHSRGKRVYANSGLKQIFMTVVPIVVTVGAARFASAKIAQYAPAAVLNVIPAQYLDLAISAVLLGAGVFATKKIAPLRKHASSILTGLGVNVVVSAAKAFLPASVKGMVGLSGDGLYDAPMGYTGRGVGALYAEQGNYIEVGDQTQGEYAQIGDYVEVGGLEADLGALEAELGGAPPMRALVPHASQLAPIATRAMVAPVPQFSPSMDEGGLYSGIFGGQSMHNLPIC